MQAKLCGAVKLAREPEGKRPPGVSGDWSVKGRRDGGTAYGEKCQATEECWNTGIRVVAPAE